jgi:hypothetical protein
MCCWDDVVGADFALAPLEPANSIEFIEARASRKVDADPTSWDVK